MSDPSKPKCVFNGVLENQPCWGDVEYDDEGADWFCQGHRLGLANYFPQEPNLFKVLQGSGICGTCKQVYGAGTVIARRNEKSHHWPSCPEST